jgi:Flp pilus assembly protein TadG
MRRWEDFSRAFRRRFGVTSFGFASFGVTGRRAASECGGALIESALVLPILLLLLTGATEFAMAAYGAIEVTNAANAGADYGAASAIAAQDTAGIQLAAHNDATNVPLNPATVTRTYICSNGSAASGTPPVLSCFGGSAVETILTVATQATYSPPVHWPGLPKTFTLNGQAVRKVSQ